MKAVPWGLAPGRVSEVLRALRFRYHKWDLYVSGICRVLPESIVLSRREHEELVRIAEAFAALLARLEDRILGEPRWIEALGIDPALVPLLRSEERRDLHFARYDFFRTPEGRWLFTEFNEDVPGGFNEAAGLPELLAGERLGGRFEGDVRRAVTAALRGAATVGILYATAFAEDLQHMAIVEDWLRAEGQEAVLAAPSHLAWRRGRAALNGCIPDAYFRFYPGEWVALLPNLPAWRRAAAGMRMMNPLSRLIRQSKLLFALWREEPVAAGDDVVLLDAHTPFTRRFRPEDAAALGPEREHWVVKRAFGRMGDAVVIGALVPPREWELALREAAKKPGEWCVQERFDVAPLAMEAGSMSPTVGVYLVNGRFAGYYSRVAPAPFITHEAYHVATVVEGP